MSKSVEVMGRIDMVRSDYGLSKKYMCWVMGITYKHYRCLLRGEARLRVDEAEKAFNELGFMLDIKKLEK
jgi:hypothetical protein